MKAIFWAVCLVLAGCGGQPRQPDGDQLAAIASRHPIKARMLALATNEWNFFGQQRVVYLDEEESIPHVGFWEDDDPEHSYRVNRYWQAAGRPTITGEDCRQSWSAAFISWVMGAAGVPQYQFPPAEAHWIYVTHIIRQADEFQSDFVPHGIKSYRPKPGDLICAGRGPSAPLLQHYPLNWRLFQYTPMHCDIVVARKGLTLEAIGGNVRNSVSKSILTLDRDGYLQPTPRRPWFLVIENRL